MKSSIIHTVITPNWCPLKKESMIIEEHDRIKLYGGTIRENYVYEFCTQNCANGFGTKFKRSKESILKKAIKAAQTRKERGNYGFTKEVREK